MKKSDNFDFGGYATKANLKCADGRVILPNAFKECDGMTVPLVWQHMHNEPSNVLGHALLENRDDGVYAHCRFNESDSGKNGKILVRHGDITSLSVYANDLIEKAKSVMHGVIREVSICLSGQNPGAKIDYVSISHADGSITDLDDEAIIYTGLPLDLVEDNIVTHADNKVENKGSDDNRTVKEVFNSLTEEQKTVVYAIIDQVVQGTETEESEEKSEEKSGEVKQSNLDEEDEGDKVMKHNVFEAKEVTPKTRLTREQFGVIMADAMQMGSLKSAVMKHAGTYGIDNLSYLFPDVQAVGEPELIMRDMAWVADVLGGVRRSRFSRIKSLSADITVETARALGYQLGDLKVEEVFALAKRETTPQTIYKKQKLDRDDIVDITDMDVVSWMKSEMRVMLNEEIARAILISDGRLVSDDYKIDETKIRPIWLDAAFYTYRHLLLVGATTADIIDSFVSSRQFYEGSGTPDAFVAPGLLTSMLLVKDTTGRRIYNTEAELAAALRVRKIVEVPLMTGLQVAGTPNKVLRAIVVNLRDYNAGADRGGEINFFDDFDIDYNQYKYLLETRMSGALVKYRSAVVIEQNDA